MSINFTIPNNLSEIPLCRYQQFVEVQQKSNDEELIAKKMIQIFCGIELKNVVKIKVKDINALITHFTAVFNEKPQLIRQFKIKDIEFGFIPDFENISFGEYIDLENNLQNWNTYHKAMAVMFRPINEKRKDKYSIIEYEPNADMQELMKFAPLDVAISAAFFFQNLGTELLNLTMNYLKQEQTKMTNSQSSRKDTNLESVGVGIQASINALKEMSLTLTTLPNYDLLNVSHISHLKNKKTK